ncbi:MAG: hypothetical protein ACLFUI_09645, partial [Halanaerobiales bacterium]
MSKHKERKKYGVFLKSFLITFLLLILVIGAFGCSRDLDFDGPGENTPEPKPEEPAEPIHVEPGEIVET